MLRTFINIKKQNINMKLALTRIKKYDMFLLN